MPKPMPLIAEKCVGELNDALVLASATETLWLSAPPASAVRRQLKARQLEALYEATFLRQFTVYEAYVEDLLVHLMAKYFTHTYTPIPSPTYSLRKTLTEARSDVYGPMDYKLWHNPTIVEKRVRGFLQGSVLEAKLVHHRQTLEDLAAIRHHIAHGSADSKAKYFAAAGRIAATTSPGTVGHLLRANDNSDPLNPTKWIRRFTDQIADVVHDFAA